MKLSIRNSALVMILVPTLVVALAVGTYATRQRFNDARVELEARGAREAAYLASASELPLLVGDSDTLQRLAASNHKVSGSALAVLFLDAAGRVLAASGTPWEVGLALQCWRAAADCSDGEQRYLFHREIRATTASEDGAAFGTPESRPVDGRELLGSVVLSFDPHALENIQRGMLLSGIGITVAALLLALVLARLFARRLVVPMQQLSSVVMRIRAGDLAARTQSRGTGELRELEEGVNAMADRVQAASEDLSRRVDEATSDLSRAMLVLEQRNTELVQARERAEAASRAKDLFLARMSHELRTPLTTVMGYAHSMQQSESPEQRADFGRSIAQASRILMTTVDDILDFVRMESDAVHLEERDFEFDTCVEDAVRMQALNAQQHGIELVCHLDGAVPARVRGDSVRLAQVLANLISNAVKFTREGAVTVRVTASPPVEDFQRVGIEVRDTGIGIEERSIPHLFQPFAQADESITRRFGGSGLGLAITAHIVRALGGTIALASRLGEGTTVRVELPLRRSADEDDGFGVHPLRTGVICRPGNPHLPVVLDYLGRHFTAVDLAQAQATGEAFAVDLVVLLDDVHGAITPPAPAAALPQLRLQPISALTQTHQQYLDDVLPLPVRRRDLVAACLRLLRAGPATAELAAPVARPQLALRCLVVEDNDLNRRMMVAQLRDWGLCVFAADGGRTALDVLAREAVELVLMDVHMPEMDGIELAGHIRARWPQLPVYALTANVIGSEDAALAAAGVRAVLYKPIDEERLLAILAQQAVAATPAWSLLPRPGIAAGEILAEFARLLAQCDGALATGEHGVAVSSAHQLLGAARLFTQGELAAACLALETALRAGETVPATAQLARIGRAVAAGSGC